MPHYFFLLGGHDLEMLTIRELIEEVAPGRFVDKQLGWGAKTSDYRDEIANAHRCGLIPVLVELENDLGLRLVDAGDLITSPPGGDGTISPDSDGTLVDHHGARAGVDSPTSLEQVFILLRLPRSRWTRWFDLVAANDRGYIPAMRAMGATGEEIANVRAADRAAQGITAAHEREAEAATAGAESFAGGELVVVRLPHEKTAAVVDRLAMQANPPPNVLVLCPNEVNFFGRGDLVRALDAEFPGGWLGGDLPEHGFWGHAGEGERVRDFLLTRFAPKGA
ncbi:MAG: hypothetical protein ACYC7A_10630 [Thermoanaerobaculia bacterium]